MVDDCSVRFCSLNHNKRSVRLDLSKPEGKELFLQLVETALVDGLVSALMMEYVGCLFPSYDQPKAGKVIVTNIPLKASAHKKSPCNLHRKWVSIRSRFYRNCWISMKKRFPVWRKAV